jgi:tRNA(Ile)-lysidine synthase
VAVSGGPDSVALAAALTGLDGSRRLALAHVNHGLRAAESDADARFVERLGRRLGLQVFVLDGVVPAGGNLEERARERRYAELVALARREGFRALATGHTLDDQAETVLLRLLRGAGVTGLVGIAPDRRDGVVRPLLGCSRHDVLEFLSRRRFDFRRDRSNRSLVFTRNRIRRSLLPRLEREFNPAIREILARTAELLRDDEDWLEAAARRAGRRAQRGEALDAENVRRLAPALQRRVIRQWLTARRGDLRRVTADHVEAVRKLACFGRDAERISLPGGTVSRSRGDLRWGTAPPQRAAGTRRLQLNQTLIAGQWRIRSRREALASHPRPRPGRWRAVFDDRVLGRRRIGVRSPAPGDRVRPLGLGGSRKLQDVFVDAKVPRSERGAWPVVYAGRTILWLPGLVRSDVAPLIARSRYVLVIEARPEKGAFPLFDRSRARRGKK